MEFTVLGSVELVGADGPVPLGGPKQRLLLAALLASRNRVVSLDSLSEAMWGDDPPPTVRSTLQTSVSKLRRLVVGCPSIAIDTRGPGYCLGVDADAVDADRFESQLARSRSLITDRPADAVALLDAALGLWAGEPFAGFEDRPWAQAESARLRELRLQAIEERNGALLGLGERDAVIGQLEGLVLDEPLRERMWSQLVTALHGAGRQGDALRAAATFRRHLRDELGLDPSAEFVALERTVLEGTPPDAAVLTHPTGPPTPGPAAPARAAPLVGRAAAVDDVLDALATARMVTITGPGGVGKSSLANEVARRTTSRFPDGVRVVELAPVADGSAVIAAVAQAVDAERRSERSLADAIVEVLAPQRMLLVLDNCEHVIGTVGELVVELVRWCPSVTLLATCREPIGMPGEAVRPLAPLAVPLDPSAPVEQLVGSPSVEVFVARATEAAPGFRLDESNAPAVAQLCIQLDGLPLALELAAARMSAMSPRQLADRLDERFALLGSGHGRGARHRSLRDVVQWSYGLLDEPERALFARVSVFAGGFDLESAETACADAALPRGTVAGVLGGLVDKSLVAGVHVGDEVRYSQLETLRQFGAECLDERSDGPAVRAAHLATFVARATKGGEALDTAAEGEWALRLDRDMDNLRAAFTTAVAFDDVDAALRLAVSASELGFRAIRYEVVDWAETVAAMPAAAEHPLRPTALGVVGLGAFVRGELERALALAADAVALRERIGVAACGLPERVLANALFYLGRPDEALAWIDRLAESTRATGRQGRLAHALYMGSVARTSTGDADGGRRFADAAVAVAAGTGSPTARSQAAYAAGLSRSDAEPADALRLLEESAVLADSVGNRWMRCFARTEVMWLRAKRGELDVALSGFREVVETWFRGGDWANQWLSLRYVAGVLASVGRDEDAALLSGCVEAAGATTALPFAPNESDELTVVMAGLAERLGTDALADARRRGGSMRADAAVAHALAAIDALLAARSA
ncbi:BTAD domain-containing putative transcriptional regulator [Dermatobacter hominis]|uniref:BTAD domain-containing putative transcriptional regulator n=1 Tax=Dermatobacter hominis TaxID=2884263 RepID=UPI001D11AB04|nr:BTAD domain-containing putative transcriptional regulator [Dermatobacter hominis]UDY34552.1 winged helix-turn-helix domain-containing protein [Dermatobacter hominis]